MLTGESVPVMKNCLSPTTDVYDPSNVDNSKKFTLYSGTRVIQTKQYGNKKVYGLVIRTGFTTTKGSLVRDILYPTKTKFKFYRDSLIFVGLLALVAVFGFLATLPIMINNGETSN